ncbi:MAG: hypothetical protein JO015_16575 [Verrucomicrobia bacterium]|nr:hypothetical protein [Verrucomicrobiota bacterium]
MRFLTVIVLVAGIFGLAGCDNRTQEDRRWEQIATNLSSTENIQPWHEARTPWSSEEHHEGTAW